MRMSFLLSNHESADNRIRSRITEITNSKVIPKIEEGSQMQRSALTEMTETI